MVPFQKGPCGEGGRMRGFLLPLLEAAVVVLVLLLIFLNFRFPLLFFLLCISSYNTKVNKINFADQESRREEEKRSERTDYTYM